jgi:nucleoside-diphosphate-sugar epimerase
MARILVTGGCGFVGSHLSEKLAQSGHDVTVFDITPARAAQSDAIRYNEGDARDESALAPDGGMGPPQQLVARAGD